MSAPNARLLVVGAGQAGVQLVCGAREEGWTGPITLVGSEAHPPYARPALSKGFLAGTATMDSEALRAPDFYAEQGIDLVLRERIEDLVLSGGGAGRARSASGRTWEFDRLALATGARPRSLPIEGADLSGVRVLREADDAFALKEHLERVSELAVIGAGFVGLEVAAAAAAAGIRVTVVEGAAQVMGRAVGAATADLVAALHQRAGVRLLTGARPRRLVDDGGGAVCAVELESGERIEAELVLVGVGAVPNDDLARAAGLETDNGVVVNSRSLASDGHTLAVGDCANLPDPCPVPGPSTRLRLESVDNAVEQARAAAATLVGADRPYQSVPWFWSDQGGVKLQIAGLAFPGDDSVVRTAGKPGRQTVLRYRGERLVAAECVNAPADFLTVRKALVAGRTLSRDAAADTGRRLKELLDGKPTAVAG
ncbi:NAD(P)/FAD-dependent oxidoreductase [Nocardiopsis dassonvillei]|uniref:NAD(P)/FAD-dependent oxidoreductase n=1 Tax=Nocardiopsis dassonvillei TaxID=2014 RepID=UPI00366DD6F9